MRRALVLAVLALSLFSSTALPQQAPATGSIEGIVVRSDTGEPIANAQVTLTSVGAPLSPGTNVLGQVGIAVGGGGFGGAIQSVTEVPAAVGAAQGRPTVAPITTSADGKFSFKDLPAGTYRVAATANGFVRQEYGQRALNGLGRPLFLTAGQPIKDTAIRLTATGTIFGRVFDENGQPATGAPLQLVRFMYTPQGRTFQAAGTAAADDRGDYRIYGVTPGRYYLVAGTPPGPARPVALGGGPAGSARFGMVLYPNATDVEQASPIEVRSGGESSIDMRVKRETQTFHVRGRIIDPTGTALPPNTNVALGYRTITGGGGSFSTGRNIDFAAGTFDVPNVSPGDYTVQIQLPVQNATPLAGGPIDPGTLFARQAEQQARPSASVPVRVTNADIDGIVLTLTTGATTTGKLIVEGQPISAVPNLERLRVSFTSPPPALPGMGAPAASPFAADGSFQVVGLREGEYRVQMAVPGFYLKSFKYGGEEILGKLFKFSGSGSGTFEVTLRVGAPTVTGTVTDAKSQPVPGIQVFFVPAQRGRLDLFRSAATDQNGKFSAANLSPGEYKVFSWEAADNAAFFDPDFLKQYEQQGKTIVVEESSNPSVDVRLIPAP